MELSDEHGAFPDWVVALPGGQALTFVDPDNIPQEVEDIVTALRGSAEQQQMTWGVSRLVDGEEVSHFYFPTQVRAYVCQNALVLLAYWRREQSRTEVRVFRPT